MTSGQAAEAPRLVRDVLLFDGSTLRLRAPVADDLEDIAAFYDGLSNESRFMRFHGYGRTDIAARALTEAGGVDRLALIARHGGRVVASAQYDLLREPGVAEVAFAVADDFQRRGTATRMLEQLASIAAERRLHRFDAEVLASNQAMLTVFERAGFDVRRKGAFGELTVSLDITPTDSVRDLIDERDHLAAVASVRPILRPGSVAVVGASSAPGDLGGEVLASILRGGFRGVAMPVNRTGEVVHSTRCALSLMELAETPELVILAVAPEELAEAASQAVAKGAKALLVLSADFSEDETEVSERQEELLEVVRAGGLRLLGPSSLGVINTDPEVRLNATSAGPGVAAGRLAVCSRSGAIGLGLLAHAAARRIGICSYVSLGERVDISTNDLLELWEEDDRAGVVMLYVETFGNPEHFARIAGRVSRRKPILAVKGRRAAEAVRHGAQTHTAAALRGEAVVDALFHQAGVLRFRSGDDLFNAARFFGSQPLPFGRRIAIVSNSTGVATLAADACATRGLVVSDAASQCANPVRLGIGAGAEEYVAAVRAALADPGVDALMVYYVARYGGEPAKVLAAISDVALGWRKPVVTSIVATDGTLPDGSASSVPNFLFPESCASVLGRAAERREWLSRPLGERPRFDDLDADAARAQIEACLERDGGWAALNEAEALLATHGIAVEPSMWCAGVVQAVEAALAVGGPIALKAALPPPQAASDIDAVLLGLDGGSAVQAGWRELERRVGLAGRRWAGAVVQRLLPPGADVLVGAVTDPDLGPVMAVGLGGRQAGLAGAAAFRLLPTTDVAADELIDASEGVVARLDGFRGAAPLHREALRELILRFACLLRECREAVEVDLNPVRLLPDRCVVLEVRLRAERRPAPQRVKTW